MKQFAPYLFSKLFYRSEVENVENEKEILLKKLVEVEVDGKAAAEEVGKLRDTVRRLKHVSTPNSKVKKPVCFYLDAFLFVSSNNSSQHCRPFMFIRKALYRYL